MTEIVLPPKNCGVFYRYLFPLLPEGSLVTEEPNSKAYNEKELLVILKDGGQSGPQYYTFWDCLTTIEVRHPVRGKALEVSRKVDALLRGAKIPDVMYISNLGCPTYNPYDEERRIPAYTWTVEHRIRGESTQIEDISFR